MKNRTNSHSDETSTGEHVPPRGPLYHQSHYGEPAYYAAAYGGEPDGDDEGIDILKLLRVLLRRWYTVLIFIVLGGLAAWLYAQRATPIFMAEAELEMSVRRPKVINSQAVYDDSSTMRDTDAIINTRFAKFRSPSMERMAIAEYQKRFPDEQRSEQALAYYVRRNVNWSKDKRSNIVRVSTMSPDPRFAAQLINVLSYSAGALMIQENQALSDGAVQWLNDQVEDQRESLDAVERKLATLRAGIQLDSMRQRKDALGAALNEVAAEKSAVENRLEARKATLEFVLEILAEKQDVEKLPTGLPKEAEINALVAAWREARNELEKSADNYTEHHPEYQRLFNEERRARKAVDDFIQVSGDTIRNEIRLLERQLGQLSRRVEQMEAQSIDLEQKLVKGEQQFISLERQREAADDAYRAILQRMEQARMSADENTAFINIIREAAVPQRPVSPRKVRILAMGLFAGALLGAALAFLIEFWSDKIALVGDLKDLGLNILGTIPSQKNAGTRGDLATIGLKDKFSHVFEIFAGINTLVSADRYADRTKVMLVCSVMPGEGKTISSSNLAISSALNGSRTLLIDGDLRRPRLARIFGISEDHASLLEWLSSNDRSLDCEHLVNRDVHEHLDVITSRPSKSVNPAELMGRAKLRELIDWGRANYDRVIIDSPPIGLVGDTQALANQADSVIIVSRLGKTKKRALKFALSRLTELDAAVLGCIANDVPHSISGMFKGGQYGYAYGYTGYGGYKSYGKDDD